MSPGDHNFAYHFENLLIYLELAVAHRPELRKTLMIWNGMSIWCQNLLAGARVPGAEGLILIADWLVTKTWHILKDRHDLWRTDVRNEASEDFISLNSCNFCFLDRRNRMV